MFLPGIIIMGASVGPWASPMTRSLCLGVAGVDIDLCFISSLSPWPPPSTPPARRLSAEARLRCCCSSWNILLATPGSCCWAAIIMAAADDIDVLGWTTCGIIEGIGVPITVVIDDEAGPEP